MGRLQQHHRALSAGARNHAGRTAPQSLACGARIRQPGGMLELVGLQRRPPISDQEGRPGRGDLEDDPAPRGEVERDPVVGPGRNRFACLAKALALGLAAVSPAHAAEKLGSFPVDPAQVSVAGFSSGAFMANQLHIAHSADLMGAAMIAGGLYGCAVEDVTPDGVDARASQAFGPCVRSPLMLDEVSSYKKIVDKLAAKGFIDPPSNLARAKLYFFTGGSDSLVPSATVEKGRDLYLALGVP